MAKKPDKTGYRRPPVANQFRKGTSGNPKGRPKGATNFKTDVLKMLESPVPLERNGKIREVTTQKAFLLRLREHALKGHPGLLHRALDLAFTFNNEQGAANEPLTAEDQEILDAYADKIVRRAQQKDGVVAAREEETDE